MTDTQLTPEDVARYPRPGMDAPRNLAFTPDGRKVAYLASAAGTLIQDLWTYEIASGVRRRVTDVAAASRAAGEVRSVDEELRRERSRTRETGVTSYQFAQSADGSAVLLVAAAWAALGRPWRWGRWCHLLRRPKVLLMPRLSPDGAPVAFVRGDEIYVMPARGGAAPHRLTWGAGGRHD